MNFTKNISIFLSITTMIIVWKVIAMWAGSEFIFPSPEKVVFNFFNLIFSPDFYPAIGSTLLRGTIGFLLSFLLAAIIGVISGLSDTARYFFNPFLVTIRSTPVISVILLALIWFSSDSVPVFIALLTMFPILCVNIIDGIKNVDRELVEMANTYNLPWNKIISNVYLPATAPFIFSGMSNALGFGWRAIIIGEVLSQPLHGIGSRMQLAQTYLLVSEVISWTIVAIIFGFIFEQITRLGERRFLKWKYS